MFEFDSYKSEYILFPKVICSACNESRTRPHDDSYDRFIQYVAANYDELFQNKHIDFQRVFGEYWKDKKRNLYRYIAKHAGCKIVTADQSYDVEPLSAFIRGAESLEGLKIHFQLKEGIKIVSKLPEFPKFPAPNLGNGGTIDFYDHEDCLCYAGWTYYQWISIVWVASNNIRTLNDFSSFREPIEVKYFRDCDSLNNAKNLQEVYLAVENSGINKRDDLITYYTYLLQQ